MSYQLNALALLIQINPIGNLTQCTIAKKCRDYLDSIVTEYGNRVVELVDYWTKKNLPEFAVTMQPFSRQHIHHYILKFYIS
jgi:hypothetical protein